MSVSHIDHYIGGQRAAGTSGRSQAVTNPATGAVTGQVALPSGLPALQAGSQLQWSANHRQAFAARPHRLGSYL